MSDHFTTASIYSKTYLRWALFLLAGIGFISTLDQAIVAVLAEPIRKDLGLSDTELGLLIGLPFAIFYALCAIPLARIADRGNRPRLLGACAALWSLMTALAGVTYNFPQLLLTRLGVAVGESGYQPATFSLVADYFPAQRRSSAFAVLSIGGTLGLTVALVAGGLLSDALGWRLTVIAIGLAGLLLAAIAFVVLKEPRRDATPSRHAQDVTFRATWTHLRHSRTYVLFLAAACLCSLPSYSIFVWAPAFFMRSFDLSAGEVGLFLGPAVGVAGITGQIVTGWLADRAARLSMDRAMLVPAITMLLTGPLFSVALLSSNPAWALALFAVSMLSSGMWYAPLFACMQSATPPRMRAQATAIILLVNSIVTYGLGPTLIGVFSDILSPGTGTDSLRFVLVSMANLSLMGAFLCWRTGCSMARDTAAVTTASPAT